MSLARGRRPVGARFVDAMRIPISSETWAEDNLLRHAAETGRLRLSTTGDCMRPLVADGDEVEIVEVSGRLRRGWLVIARVEAALVCHRVLIGAEDGVRLAGDRSAAVDLVNREAILGRVRAVRRDGRIWRYAERPSLLDRGLGRLLEGRLRGDQGPIGRRLGSLARRLLVALRLSSGRDR